MVTQLVRSYKNIYGGIFIEDETGGASYYMFSVFMGATPDGRRNRETFNDGTVSSCIGTDRKGPTAVLKSVGKIDHATNSTNCLNQKFLPMYISDKYKGKGKGTFVAYLRCFVDLSIYHIHFNIIEKNILLDAQKHPENYQDLVVRVAVFSAYFVDMEKEVQDQTIARTEQELR